MKRWLNILVFIVFSVSAFAQVDTRVVDSLQEVLATQEGREKVKTMLELTWDFYDVSFDDCIDWGEKAVEEAKKLGFADLQAKANYVLGIQYAYHADLDLAESYLHKAYSQYITLGDTANAFESLWFIATYEMTLGSVDTAYKVYEQALPLAEQLGDTSAYAYVLSNMGLIEYKRLQLEKSYQHYDRASRLFMAIGDEPTALRIKDNMAAICTDGGHADEARLLYWEVIPKLEQFQDYYHLVAVCKNMGSIYENEFVDYDSAMFYLQKALDYASKPMENKEYQILADNEKSEVMVGMANVLLKKGNVEGAVRKFDEALKQAEKCGYSYGVMESCLGLGKVYSQLGQASKSMHYFDRFFELEKASGVTMMSEAVRKPLSMNYARLGRFDELDRELADFEERINDLMRKSADLEVQNQTLRSEASELFDQYESQAKALQEQQTMLQRYRLAFFGLLALVLATLAILAVRKIVQRNSPKNEN